jgi:hypothetical protein
VTQFPPVPARSRQFPSVPVPVPASSRPVPASSPPRAPKNLGPGPVVTRFHAFSKNCSRRLRACVKHVCGTACVLDQNKISVSAWVWKHCVTHFDQMLFPVSCHSHRAEYRMTPVLLTRTSDANAIDQLEVDIKVFPAGSQRELRISSRPPPPRTDPIVVIGGPQPSVCRFSGWPTAR